VFGSVAGEAVGGDRVGGFGAEAGYLLLDALVGREGVEGGRIFLGVRKET
jgi:hypothetical protein